MTDTDQHQDGKFYLMVNGQIDPTQFIIYKNGVGTVIPAESIDLAERKLILDRLVDEELEVKAAMYMALALDFEAAGQNTVADVCRRRADRLAARAAYLGGAQ